MRTVNTQPTSLVTTLLLAGFLSMHSIPATQAQPKTNACPMERFAPTDSVAAPVTSLGVTPLANHLSIETDPVFWLSTLPNGPAFDANVNIRLRSAPRWRFGVLGYRGKWTGSLAKSLLLSKEFTEPDWGVQWQGLGMETQYQIRLGLTRGGLQPGVRLQWNQLNYQQREATVATANHFVVTPQVGFQWFPFTKLGLYILPWVGAQLPVAGTDGVLVHGSRRASRPVIPVATAHVGWEFSF